MSVPLRHDDIHTHKYDVMTTCLSSSSTWHSGAFTLGLFSLLSSPCSLLSSALQSGAVALHIYTVALCIYIYNSAQGRVVYGYTLELDMNIRWPLCIYRAPLCKYTQVLRVHVYTYTVALEVGWYWDMLSLHHIFFFYICIYIEVYIYRARLYVHMCTANPTWGDIFESSKLKARKSLLPRFSKKGRSSFELWALKQHSKMSPQVGSAVNVECLIVVQKRDDELPCMLDMNIRWPLCVYIERAQLYVYTVALCIYIYIY